ncbi:zinc finger protein 414 [Cheilinus undulatus]|uniref:zinc finger protein 414 n=1 Tax=Cheilinus undulatus TaxID=241271 RepID=UPI001BD62E11|nr:zinc finger protein 414 [Cheilinus undulatus]
MMPLSSTLFDSEPNENGGKQRTPCPLYGCKRVYTDNSSLETHIKDHEIPAESLPGKVLLCSNTGCGGSFPNMQKLMEHIRHHHKPNIYFLCENCRTKLRTYKGLLTHLHTCSKVSQGKTKPHEPAPPPSAPSAAPVNPSTTPMDQDPPQLESVLSSQQPQTTDGAFPVAAPQPEAAAPPHLGPPFLPSLDPAPPLLNAQQLTDAALLTQLTIEAPEMPPSLNLEGAAVVPALPETWGQQQAQTGSSEPPQPAPASAPQSPSSSAVWRKNQALTSNRRVLWEHTRGRYTCIQCGFTVTNRKDMTQHINSQHSGNKAAEDMESSPATSK